MFCKVEVALHTSIAANFGRNRTILVRLGSVLKPGDPPLPPLKRGENSVKVPFLTLIPLPEFVISIIPIGDS
jgi:hypothetical protein